MSFFEDIAAALDRDGIESRVGGDTMFVPLTAELEIQFVEIDPHLPAANVYIAAADVDEDDEDFEAVLVAVELALQSGRVSAEHVLNVLSRLQEQRISEPPVATMLTLSTPPQANLQRYDALRNALPLEASQESDHA